MPSHDARIRVANVANIAVIVCFIVLFVVMMFAIPGKALMP